MKSKIQKLTIVAMIALVAAVAPTAASAAMSSKLSKAIEAGAAGNVPARTLAPGPIAVRSGEAEATQSRRVTTASMRGAVTTTDGRRQAGASVYLYRYNGSSWTNLGLKTRTDSNGVYTIGGLAAGSTYAAVAGKAFGGCEIGYFAIYNGVSKSFTAQSGWVYNTPIKMAFRQNIYC